jgi:4-diphosphocytidyl-2-C-methyl-D-erythritol kinase
MDPARAGARRARGVSRSVVVEAPAKINLTLEVLGRRADGFHDLASIFATIDLCDRVRVTRSRSLDVRVSPGVGARPEDELATRAVHAFADATEREPRAHVRVRKRIPVAAGLGGGSSDAAAVLRGLSRLWRVDAELNAIAARVGSDVPFFASGAAFALVTGRGERVEPLPAPAIALWIVLVRVNVRVSTADVFGAMRSTKSEGARSRAIADRLRNGTVTAEFLRAHLSNDLLDAAQQIAPSIAEARNLAAARRIDLAMSGSGPSLFALADDRPHALRIARALRRAGMQARPHRVGTAF